MILTGSIGCYLDVFLWLNMMLNFRDEYFDVSYFVAIDADRAPLANDWLLGVDA